MPALVARRRTFAAIPFMLLTALLITCTMIVSTASQADALTRSERARKVHHGLRVAISQVGDPYIYGAAGPNAFDCSGLTMYSYRKAGLYLPRSSSDQARYVRHIRKNNIRRGDLMFFYGSGGVYHVAIYLGRARDGRALLLHAPYPGQRVHRERVWTSRWYAGTLRFR